MRKKSRFRRAYENMEFRVSFWLFITTIIVLNLMLFNDYIVNNYCSHISYYAYHSSPATASLCNWIPIIFFVLTMATIGGCIAYLRGELR